MKKSVQWAIGGVAAGLVLLQLTNPARTNPPVVSGHDLFAVDPPPAEIAESLRNACYDCHSHETRWPWYSHVAPVSWWLVHHIDDARKHLNFSEWPHDDPRRAARKWRQIADEVSAGTMPLPSYARMHAEARLTAEQRAAIARWAARQAERLRDNAPGD